MRGRNNSDEIEAITGSIDKLASIDSHSAPSLLILSQPLLNADELERLESLSIQNPAMAIILICQQQSPDFLLRAMRAGVREVLTLQADPAQLLLAVRRLETKRSSQPQGMGKVLSFVSCKGGSGATFSQLTSVSHSQPLKINGLPYLT
ncbi:hypothetical protein ACHMW6_22595 [Pseudoduganella sp. UC29_106]|uniref:hypothetical protein n=1 Tax=Pseudoduganella sp. UC29_106 TaxID=3374553 RepID=UPI0037578357